jgi:hypothetical protein
VVELQSWAYHRGRAAFERDNTKLADLRLAGFDVLPVTDRKLAREPAWVVGAVRSCLRR